MAESAPCVFCRIVEGEIPCFKLHEDPRTLAFMDINPFHDGHCLVITKAHAENLYAADEADLAAAIAVAKRLAIAVNQVLRPDGINLVQANGAGAGQSVFHFHFHVFPRKLNDNAQFNWGHKPGDMARIGELAERIKRAMP
ncbi:MAG: HIT domain-containing protein [Alphaproteobacteria bacterium]|nr:HIT domain-containing protein [Alphaproteobacteria bacterium]